MEYCNINTTGIERYEQENQELADFFLNEYFYKYFYKDSLEKDQYARNIELIISPLCNLGCKYCYVNRYRNKIFDGDCANAEKTITNLKLILKWMTNHKFNPNIEIFSGELLAQNLGFDVLNTIYEHEKSIPKDLRCKSIVIPTNFTFICSEEATQKVEDIRLKLKDIEIDLGLSASFDGKYMEQNRPYLHDLDIPLGGLRDDSYYDKAFTYGHMIHGGFHPMIYSEGIKDWPKNFDWFQEKMAEHDISWDSLYLLQVRNEEWTKEQIEDLCDFLKYLYAFGWEKVNHNPHALVDWILKGQGFNILAQPFTTCGRGLTCGIQSQFTIRVSDLMMYPCHRTGYKDFYCGQMIETNDDEVLRYKNMNAELLIATFSLHKESFPFCAECPINKLCTGTCLGAQYESNNNLLVPIPTVCELTYAMCITGMECLKKYEAWSILLENLDEGHLRQFQYLEGELKNNVK